MKYALRIVAALGLVALLAGIAWVQLRPPPTLDGVTELIRSGRLAEAQKRIAAFLRSNPGRDDLRLTLARFALDRPDPDPATALEQLPRLRLAYPELAPQLQLLEGKALFYQHRLAEAEAAFNRALALDPQIAEAGWALQNIYVLQARRDDARRLALRLFAVEPDPHDRVQILLQLLREHAHPTTPGSLVYHLEPAVKADPGDLRSATALGLAELRDGKAEAGLRRLREIAEKRAPRSAEAWHAYVTGLMEAGRVAELRDALDRLPPALAADARFEAGRGLVAQARGDWNATARAYLKAWQNTPWDEALAYRLRLALRAAGKTAELARLEPRLKEIDAASKRLRQLFDKADTTKSLGKVPNPDLYTEFAEALEAVGRLDEARAWYRLVLEDRPGDRRGAEALQRLGDKAPRVPAA